MGDLADCLTETGDVTLTGGNIRDFVPPPPQVTLVPEHFKVLLSPLKRLQV